MKISLGIHLGHDSSCAIAVDGKLVAAIQAERITRIKHHPIYGLSNTLPIEAVLHAADITLDQVDIIVSSFQWAWQGGFGLHRQLIEPDFSLFDPFDPRHHVISHHLAHAHSTFEPSGFDKAAVLICDYAGSASIDGKDYSYQFGDWYTDLTSASYAQEPKVECMSLYSAERGKSYQLLERQFNLSHPGQASFIYSIAGLYENISKYVIGRYSAHGQLMALAAYGSTLRDTEYDPGSLISIGDKGVLSFKNNWQHLLPDEPSFEQKCALAWRCQHDTEEALEAVAKRAINLAQCDNLAVAGGVFLNILANTRIAESGFCSAYHVPSAPHDAGISAGCAFFGTRLLGEKSQPIRSDRLGIAYSSKRKQQAIDANSLFLKASHFDTKMIVGALQKNKIIARWQGPAEFGPRALGARSLLASPLSQGVKNRLNTLKGRQEWRPVAPMIPFDELNNFFTGPSNSDCMTLSQFINGVHRKAITTLYHPDDSTRAQTLRRHQDAELYGWLKSFGEASGYPILANTSFNRRGEPIVETPEDAIAMYLAVDEIDYLILDDILLTRTDPLQAHRNHQVTLNQGVIFTQHLGTSGILLSLTLNDRVWPISDLMHEHLVTLFTSEVILSELVHALESDPTNIRQLAELLVHNVLQLGI